MKEKQIRPLYIALIGVLLAALIGVIVAIIWMDKDADSLTDTSDKDTSSQLPEKWQEGIISYKDKYYKYNNSIQTYLLMGIDKNGPVEESADGISGGQSDALFLLVVNKDSKELSVISINRNTMTRIEMYDKEGNRVGTTTAQICTQHGFGDGKKLSCTRTVNAVSHLLYNQPINGYISINMGALPLLNDYVDGVTLTVLEDIDYPEAGVSLKKGQNKTLSGIEAYYYLRGRDTEVFDSASFRLKRQEQYVMAYMEQFKNTVNDYSSISGLYDELEQYFVTNIDLLDVIPALSEYEYNKTRLYSVPGETIQGESFEEYYVDEDALYEMMITIFYDEVKK